MQATTILPEPKQIFAGVDAIEVVNKLVDAVNQWHHIVETEQSKRAIIAAQERALLAAIAADREGLLNYLDRSFDERAQQFRELFAKVDQVIGTDSGEVTELLGAITALALKNPFADLQDVKTVTENLYDKDFVWGM